MPTPLPLPLSQDLRAALSSCPPANASVRASFVAQCTACGLAIAWRGRLLDRPACPCGHQVGRAKLELDQREADAIAQRLTGSG
jgi:predicted RNA-binding Zn-ribbon protein involved in translation (DUF1610 family)